MFKGQAGAATLLNVLATAPADQRLATLEAALVNARRAAIQDVKEHVARFKLTKAPQPALI